MSSTIKPKLGTTAQWQASGRVLEVNEWGVEKTISGSYILRIGDGENRFIDLPAVFDSDTFEEAMAQAADAIAAANVATQNANSAAETANTAAEGITARIAQTTGDSETQVMSQKAVTGIVVGTCKDDFATPCKINSTDGKLRNVTGDGSPTFYVSNKNLLPQPIEQTKGGVTLTQNDDGTITLNGTATSTESFFMTYNNVIPVQNGKFTLSLNNSEVIGDTGFFAEIQRNENSVAVCRANTAHAFVVFELSEDEAMDYFRLRVPSGTVFNNFKLAVQIEEGGKATEFVKHQSNKVTLSGDASEIDGYVGYNYLCAKTETNTPAMARGSYLPVVAELIAELGKEQYKAPLKGKKLVCFGDSIVGNYLPPTDYPTYIAERTGMTVINAGFGGCTMSKNSDHTRHQYSMVSLADSIVSGNWSEQEDSGVTITPAGSSEDYVARKLATLKSLDWNEVDYIIIAYGTNDWNSNYAIDNEDNKYDITSYIGAARYTVEKILTAYPHIKILFVTPLWRWWDVSTGDEAYKDSDNYAKGTGWYLYDYVNALKEMVKEYHIPVYDAYYNCMMNKFNRLVYFPVNDGTHPNEEGRKLLGYKVADALLNAY